MQWSGLAGCVVGPLVTFLLGLVVYLRGKKPVSQTADFGDRMILSESREDDRKFGAGMAILSLVVGIAVSVVYICFI
ncbi:MAG TPA: hypothetical protein VEB60_00880 [Candidatus Paceibacterota bacterium]|nr:hypothetical protein [Candidatus Paceibacterota bacterium]